MAERDGKMLSLIHISARAEIARDRFQTAQMRTAETVLKLAADTRRQYYRAAAANAQVAFYQEAKSSADAASELFKRLGESGGVNKICLLYTSQAVSPSSCPIVEANM